METLKETIIRMMKELDDKNIEPKIIPFVDIQNERSRLDKEEMRRLYENKEIETVRTINGHAIKISP